MIAPEACQLQKVLDAFYRHYTDMFDSVFSMYFRLILSESTLTPKMKYFVIYLAVGSQYYPIKDLTGTCFDNFV